MRNPFKREPKPAPQWGDHITTDIIAFNDFNAPAEDPTGEEWSDFTSSRAVLDLPPGAVIIGGDGSFDKPLSYIYDPALTMVGGEHEWVRDLKNNMHEMINSHRIDGKTKYDACPLCMVDKKRKRLNMKHARMDRRLARGRRTNRNLYKALERAMKVIGTNMAWETSLLGTDGSKEGFSADIRFIHGHYPEAKEWTNAAYDRAATPTPTVPNPITSGDRVILEHRKDCRICNPFLPPS